MNKHLRRRIFSGGQLESSLLFGARCGLFYGALFVFLTGHLRGQVMDSPILEAAKARAPHKRQKFPDALSSGFEDATITMAAGGFSRLGVPLPPFNEWNGWRMTGSCGIAVNGSPFTSLNPRSPEGTHVGFIQGTSTMEADYLFSPGSFRIHVRGAQRMRHSGLDHQVVQVRVGAKIIDILDFRSERFTDYVTPVFSMDVPQDFIVYFQGMNPDGGDNTAFLDDIRIERIREWNDPKTWENNIVPRPTDFVIIPHRFVVALKGLGNECRGVQVYGELHATDRDVELSAGWVLVTGESGRLQVGRPKMPHRNQFTLILTASIQDENFFGVGNKFLVAKCGGKIHLHGEQRVSWTKLNQTVIPGDTQITLASPVDWQVGDEFVVAGSNHQRSVDTGTPNYIDHAEVLRVSSLSTNRLTVFLDVAARGPVVNRHYGGAPQTYTSPPVANFPQGQTWSLDQRAEVGLLTHNIKVMGDLKSERSHFGGHIMVRHSPPGSQYNPQAFLSNVELFRMGQEQVLGRYPMHWHVMADQAKGQYIRDSSVHHTYNRAITIHGTDSLRVERNVVYHNVGHAIFMEDGAEENNRVIGNLAISTVKPPPGKEMLPSDNELEQLQNRTPASYWITNPNNIIRDNVAAGTEGTGFWFIFPEAVLGFSADNPILASRKPIENDLGVFSGNLAHSCGSAFDINDTINPSNDRIIINRGWRPRSGSAVLSNFVAYACDMGLYAGASDEDISFSRFVLADNNENIRIAAYHTVLNSIAIAGTGNVGPLAGGQRGYTVYDGPARIQDCHFVDFDQPSRWLIQSAGAAVLHPNHRFIGITNNHGSLPKMNFPDFAAHVDPLTGLPFGSFPAYCDEPRHLAAPNFWGVALRDLDGSIWGVPGSTLIGNHPLMVDPSADITPAGVPSTSNALLTTHRYGHLRVSHDGLDVGNLPTVWFRRSAEGTDPGSGIAYLNCFQTPREKQFPVIVDANSFYVLSWVSPTGFNGVEITFDDVELGDAMRLKMTGLANLGTLTISNAVQETSLINLWAATTTSYMIIGSDLFVKFANVSGKKIVHVTW